MANRTTVQGLVGMMGLFAGLCAIFALIATLADAWREHEQQSWPQATATLERCSVDPYFPVRNASRTPLWHIQCRIAYSVGSDQIETGIRSRSTRSEWDGGRGEMRRWVAEHRSGTPIVIHYDPRMPTAAVLMATDMPYAGPRTPNNLKLLLIAVLVSSGFLLIAKYSWRTNRDEQAFFGQSD